MRVEASKFFIVRPVFFLFIRFKKKDMLRKIKSDKRKKGLTMKNFINNNQHNQGWQFHLLDTAHLPLGALLRRPC